MFCSKCGKEIPENIDAKFCSYCGATIPFLGNQNPDSRSASEDSLRTISGVGNSSGNSGGSVTLSSVNTINQVTVAGMQRFVLIILTAFSSFGLFLPLVRIEGSILGQSRGEVYSIARFLVEMEDITSVFGSDANMAIILLLVSAMIFIASAIMGLPSLYSAIIKKDYNDSDEGAVKSAILGLIGVIMVWIVTIVSSNLLKQKVYWGSASMGLSGLGYVYLIGTIVIYVLVKRESVAKTIENTSNNETHEANH